MPLLPPVIAEIQSRTQDFTAGMLKARGEMDATATHGSSSFGKLAAVGQAAFLALGAAAIGVGVEAIHMADAFEGAHARLTTAVTNSGSSFDVWKGQIDATDTTMQKLGFNSTDTQSALATLTQVTHNTGTALSLMGLAADIARGRHIDLATAVSILGKVETGHIALLGRLGINTKDATGQTISQTVALQRLTAMYGGNASAYADTFAGKMQVLDATAHNLGTQLGLWLIPKVEAVASAFAGAVTWLNQNRAAADLLAIAIGGPLAVAMGAFLVLKVQAAIEGITTAFNLLTGATGRAAAATALEETAAASDAAAESLDATATAARSAAEGAAAATGALDGIGAAGAGGIATGAAAGGLLTLGAAALAIVPPLALIGWTIWDDGQKAKAAKAEIAGFLGDVATGASNAADPAKYLAGRQADLAVQISDSYKRIGVAKELMDRKLGSPSYTETQQHNDLSYLGSLTTNLAKQKAEYASLTDTRAKLDDKTTADHAKQVEAQSAATLKAIAKEKTQVGAQLAWIGSQYGKFDEGLLKAADFSSKQLKDIETKVSGAISTTDGAIRGFDDLVSHFGSTSKVTGAQVIGFLQGSVGAVRTWQGNIKTLIKDGIDRGLIEQLIQAGPKSEGEVKGILDAVAHGGKDTINVAVSQQRDLINSTNGLLADQVIKGETNWSSYKAYIESHPVTAVTTFIIKGDALSGAFNQPGRTVQSVNSAPPGYHYDKNGNLVKDHSMGGLLGSGRWSVAENMPELVDPSGYVHSGAETAAMLGRSSGRSGGDVYQVTIDARGSVGLDLDALGRVTEEALHRVSERNGGIKIRIRN